MSFIRFFLLIIEYHFIDFITSLILIGQSINEVFDKQNSSSQLSKIM